MTEARLSDARRSLAVEILEPLVRTYLVRVDGDHDLAPGDRLELVIASNPPVACTVEGIEAHGVRLRRGWGVG